jgi:hypothetical protein
MKLSIIFIAIALCCGANARWVGTSHKKLTSLAQVRLNQPLSHPFLA